MIKFKKKMLNHDFFFFCKIFFRIFFTFLYTTLLGKFSQKLTFLSRGEVPEIKHLTKTL